jgi:hypothetical protein
MGRSAAISSSPLIGLVIVLVLDLWSRGEYAFFCLDRPRPRYRSLNLVKMKRLKGGEHEQIGILRRGCTLPGAKK